MEKVIIRFNYSLLCECPKCQQVLDLVEQDDDCVISDAIFTNKWEDLKGYEIYCYQCKHEFLIKEIEY